MSRHHRAQKWSTHQPKLKAHIEALMRASGGLPCVDCGHLVIHGVHKWQVGHKQDAALGGKARVSNVGPTHSKTIGQDGRMLWPRNCNQIAGGKLGASISNGKRRASQDIRPW